jgi:hypothetical protein
MTRLARQVSGGGHTAKLSHELLAAAASYEVCTVLVANTSHSPHISYPGGKSLRGSRRKERKTGQSQEGSGAPVRRFIVGAPQSTHSVFHSAALTGGFIDRLAETKGMDAIDKERAKHDGELADLLNSGFC